MVICGMHGGGVRSVETRLDEVLSLRFRDEGLKFGGSEGIYMAGLRGNQKKDLGSCQGAEFISLLHDSCFSFAESDMATTFVIDEFNVDFASTSFLFEIQGLFVPWRRVVLTRRRKGLK